MSNGVPPAWANATVGTSSSNVVFGSDWQKRRGEFGRKSLRRASIKTTGDVYVQTIETSVTNAMNSRTMEILADWKPAVLNGKVTAINGAAPKRRALKVESQLDQLGPSTEGRVVAST